MNAHRSPSAHYSGQILIKLKFSVRIKKYSDIKFSWKSAQWRSGCCMHADRHDEANGPFSQFLRKRMRKDWINLSWLSAA